MLSRITLKNESTMVNSKQIQNYFPKRPSDAPLHTLSKLYDVPVGFDPLYFEAEYCLFCGRRRVAVARYRMICLVLVLLFYIAMHDPNIYLFNLTATCYV